MTEVSFTRLGAQQCASAFHPLCRPEEEHTTAGPEAQEEVAAPTRAEVEREAYRRGVAAGRKQAEQEWSQKQEEEQRKRRLWWSELKGEMETGLKEFMAEMEERSVRLAVAIAEKILARELRGDVEGLKQRVKRAVASCQEGTAITVRVNPGDLSPLEEDDPGRGRALVIRADENVPPGGFVVETERNVFDYTVPSMLEKIAAELEGLYEHDHC